MMFITLSLNNVFIFDETGFPNKIRKDFKFTDKDTGLLVCGISQKPELYEEILKNNGFKIIFKSERCFNYFHDNVTPRQTLIVFEK